VTSHRKDRTVRRRWSRRLDQVHELVDKVDRRTEKMEMVLIIREPSSNAAAEAYEGLRKQLVSTVDERRARLAQLVELDIALAGGADRGTLVALVDGWLAGAGVDRIDDPHHPQAVELFELVGPGDGARETIQPAYVNVISSQLIRRGRVRHRAPAPEQTPAPPNGADKEELT
jgi:hypothetical protein